MLLAQALSKNGVAIRITAERWAHIVENHDYMAGNLDKVLETLEDPDYIVQGSRGACLAMRHYTTTVISEKDVVVVYRELSKEQGFAITAFMTSRGRSLLRRKGVLWQKAQD